MQNYLLRNPSSQDKQQQLKIHTSLLQMERVQNNIYDNNSHKNSLQLQIQQVVASIVGSAVAIFTLNPINVIKVSLQNSKTQNQTINKVINKILSEKGWKGLWNGLSMGLVMSVPNTIVFMKLYEENKSLIQRRNIAIPTILQSGVAAGVARLLSSTLTSPLELIRTIQTGTTSISTTSTKDIVIDIIRKKGFSGLYVGWKATVLRDCPYSFLYWFTFDCLRSTLLSNRKQQSFGIDFLAGSGAGLLSAIITHPFDVLKTRQQLGGGGGLGGVWDIYRKEGWRALSVGLSMRLSTVIPSGAIVVSVYEYVKSI